MLKAVETRYNHAQTLQVLFHEAYTAPSQPRRTESGTLLLRKPGRMRWNYTSPEGKLFVSDGKYLWLYTPSNHQVEKMKIQESDDMRAPLAFLSTAPLSPVAPASRPIPKPTASLTPKSSSWSEPTTRSAACK
jgi:hypothetical protein